VIRYLEADGNVKDLQKADGSFGFGYDAALFTCRRRTDEKDDRKNGKMIGQPDKNRTAENLRLANYGGGSETV
jgi:hypothetical protein